MLSDVLLAIASIERFVNFDVSCHFEDMGLGKTLQSICVLASDHCARAEKFAATGGADCRHAPSLVVCPPTLTGHWKNEVEAFAPFLRVGVYVGTVAERTA